MENSTEYSNVFTSNDTDFNATTTTTSDIDGNVDDAAEIARIIQIAVRPVLIVLGTVGNCLSFYVMRRGPLKKRSYCFYMAMLALADTGMYNVSLSLIQYKIFTGNIILLSQKKSIIKNQVEFHWLL